MNLNHAYALLYTGAPKKIKEGSEVDESEIVQRMKAGDKEAFEMLYDRYKNTVYRTACLISGNSADGEDIMQETFIKVFTHIRELKDNDMFKYWLFKILNRTAWQILKKRSKESPCEDGIKEETSADSPVEAVLHIEQQNIIREAVLELDYKYRTVVILYYYNELTIRQIAQICGCMEGTVKSRLHGARSKLQKKLQKTYVEYAG